MAFGPKPPLPPHQAFTSSPEPALNPFFHSSLQAAVVRKFRLHLKVKASIIVSFCCPQWLGGAEATPHQPSPHRPPDPEGVKFTERVFLCGSIHDPADRALGTTRVGGCCAYGSFFPSTLFLCRSFPWIRINEGVPRTPPNLLTSAPRQLSAPSPLVPAYCYPAPTAIYAI